jgi:hypothetical protein
MKNQNQKIEEKKGNQSKENQIDKKNLNNIKFDLGKGNSELCNKEMKISFNKGIYKDELMKELSSDERKKFRGKIRRDLKRFISNILGKDRNDYKRISSLFAFISFYQKYWRIQDLKIENFSSSRNEKDLKDYKDLLSYIESLMQGNKINSLDAMKEILNNQLNAMQDKG